MSRYDDQRLVDIAAAIAAIREHLTHGDISNGLVFDAVRVRLIEIGEAVKTISAVNREPPEREQAVGRLAARLKRQGPPGLDAGLRGN